MQKKLSFPAFTRATQWWEPKMTLFLSIGLLTIISASVQNLFPVFLYLGMLLAAIAVCAVYVSLINDFTDLSEDIQANKSNNLKGFSLRKSLLLILLCVVSGLFFIWLVMPDYLTIALYLGSWISFSLYSFRPIRLKSRGILGVFADAFGAHLFPTLFIFVGISKFLQIKIDISIITFTGVWAACYGLRGILWHQCMDIKNDEKLNINTFVNIVKPHTIKKIEKFILLAELISFCLMMIYYHQIIVLLFLAIYMAYSWAITKFLFIENVIIIMPESGNSVVIMNHFYQTIFNIILIIQLVIISWTAIALVPVFFILFPNGFRRNYPHQRALFHYFIKR